MAVIPTDEPYSTFTAPDRRMDSAPPSSWGTPATTSSIDLAEAEGRLGRDPGPTLARSCQILESCGAMLLLREVDTTTAAAKNAPT
jgi:hypothetical protein